jgi:hypothetical protein
MQLAAGLLYAFAVAIVGVRDTRSGGCELVRGVGGQEAVERGLPHLSFILTGKVKIPTRKPDVLATQILLLISRPGHPPPLFGALVVSQQPSLLGARSRQRHLISPSLRVPPK